MKKGREKKEPVGNSKLTLRKETLRQLTESDLRRIVGGDDTPPPTCSSVSPPGTKVKLM